jgi:hypothetical protein
MNCLYCHQPTIHHLYMDNHKRAGFYDCQPCQTYFTVDDSDRHVETSIWLPGKNFVFCINIGKQLCCLYNRNKPGLNQLYYEEFRLTHIPNWTPQNIQDKLKDYMVFS